MYANSKYRWEASSCCKVRFHESTLGTRTRGGRAKSTAPLPGFRGVRLGFPTFADARSSRENEESGKTNCGGPTCKLNPPDWMVIFWNTVTGGVSVAAIPKTSPAQPASQLGPYR